MFSVSRSSVQPYVPNLLVTEYAKPGTLLSGLFGTDGIPYSKRDTTIPTPIAS